MDDVNLNNAFYSAPYFHAIKDFNHMCEGALQIFDVMTFKALYLFPCNLLSVLMIDVTLYANETSNYLVLFMN